MLNRLLEFSVRQMRLHLQPPCLRLSTAALLVALFTLAGADAWARLPLDRPLDGVVQSIDRDARTLTVLPAKGRGPVGLFWKSDMSLLHNGQFATPDALKQGLPVVAYYHSPLFGKSFATKVVWENGGK